MKKRTKVIVTIGPATGTERCLRQIKSKGVDFVRVNLSHSSLDDLLTVLQLAMKVGLPFIIDTEGSQVRTGAVRDGEASIDENDEVQIYATPLLGDATQLSLTPAWITRELEPGDLLHIGFDTLVLRVADTSTLPQGFVTATAISRGSVGSNKAVVIDPRTDRPLNLPLLSDKDLEAIQIGLRMGVGHIALSFARSGASIDEVRRVTGNSMKVIAKVECIEALHNLEGILEKSDAVLLDRGDLSKDIPLERIPFTQKIIMHRARRYGREVYVATNLLETMVRERKPTRAEVQDVVNTLVDGAQGLTLAAETAIGRYPLECINVLNTLILHAEHTLERMPPLERGASHELIDGVDHAGYLLDYQTSSALIQPHGGRLVSRVGCNALKSAGLDVTGSVRLTDEQLTLIDQIAVGAFSPLEGFLGSRDLRSVLDDMRLSDGTIWPVPIVLDVPRHCADQLCPGQPVGLSDGRGELTAVLHLSEVYEFDRDEAAVKLYGAAGDHHPGVRAVRSMHPVLLAGKIDLVKRRASESQAYDLTPRQLRRLFTERGWAKVLGFHTRSVIHRGHEFMQLTALEQEDCDGVFVHLVVGDRARGEFRPDLMIKSYETMVKHYYPKNKVVFATVPTFPRCTGPREVLLAALHHKNFGCSHFIAGRSFARAGVDDDGVDGVEILTRFPELDIKAVRMDEVRYSPKRREYVVHRAAVAPRDSADEVSLTGYEVRDMVQRGRKPPNWLIRPKVAQLIWDATRKGERVFE